MDILQYLFRIIALSTVGIVLASIIEETNLISKIKKITKPILLNL